jgi:RHS repeat-associated protein
LVYFHRNQQYSITAVTTSTGSIAERYAYTAYGQPTILDASASVLSSSAINNRYTYTGREWDATLDLHHFRARWMSGLSGGFLTRDPEGFDGSPYDLYEFANAKALVSVDPSGQWYVYCRNARNFPIFRHCDLRRECTPGEARGPDGNIELISCFPVRKSTDCWRSLNSNACPMRCCDATDQDIENCLTKYPSDNLTGNPGSNCQSNTYERLSRCCLDSNWTPNAYGRPLRKCILQIGTQCFMYEYDPYNWIWNLPCSNWHYYDVCNRNRWTGEIYCHKARICIGWGATWPGVVN